MWFDCFEAIAEASARDPIEEQAQQDARRYADGRVDGKAAGQAAHGVSAAISDHHVGDRDVGGRGEEGERCGGQRIIFADGFKDDSDLDAIGASLEEEFA